MEKPNVSWNNNIKCKYCRSNVTGELSLLCHYKNYHPELLKEGSSISTIDNQFPCCKENCPIIHPLKIN